MKLGEIAFISALGMAKKQEKVVKKILILHSVSGVANSDMISD